MSIWTILPNTLCHMETRSINFQKTVLSCVAYKEEAFAISVIYSFAITVRIQIIRITYITMNKLISFKKYVKNKI